MSRLAAYHDAFSNYPLLVKVAANLGYIPDMSTDGGEFTRLIYGKPHTTVRAFGNGESVLVAHPLGGHWRADKVTIIAADGSERNPLYKADQAELIAELPEVQDFPSGAWGLLYEPWRDNSAAWSRMRQRGLSFLVGGGEVARREGLAVWSNLDGVEIKLARHLPFYGWQGSEYLELK